MSEEEKYVLTPWGCLKSTLDEYGIPTEHISGRVGGHIVSDFLENMMIAGHILKAPTGEEKPTEEEMPNED